MSRFACDSLLVDKVFSSGNVAETLWAANDHLGSVRQLIASDAPHTVKEHREFDSFGNLIASYDETGASSTSTAALDSVFAFAGREWDEEAQLYYNRGRYYDPAVGRFLSEDPAVSDTNLYRYAGNDGVNYRDPSGLMSDGLSFDLDGLDDWNLPSVFDWGSLFDPDYWFPDWGPMFHDGMAYLSSTWDSVSQSFHDFFSPRSNIQGEGTSYGLHSDGTNTQNLRIEELASAYFPLRSQANLLEQEIVSLAKKRQGWDNAITMQGRVYHFLTGFNDRLAQRSVDHWRNGLAPLDDAIDSHLRHLKELKAVMAPLDSEFQSMGVSVYWSNGFLTFTNLGSLSEVATELHSPRPYRSVHGFGPDYVDIAIIEGAMTFGTKAVAREMLELGLSRAGRELVGEGAQGVALRGTAYGVSSQRTTVRFGDATTSPWLVDTRIGVRSHIESFRDGGSYLVPKSIYQNWIQGQSRIGRPDGQFITTRAAMDRLLNETAGNLGAVKRRLGIPDEYWNEPLYRVDIDYPLLHNSRLPAGWESGANELFRWGGYTSGGLPEVIIEQVPMGGFRVIPTGVRP